MPTPSFGIGNDGRDGMRAPMGPPPRNIPSRPSRARGAVRAVDSDSIRHCMRRFTFIWLDNGNGFWMFPVQLGRQSVSGFRWIPRFGWRYTGLSLSRIDAFTCM